MGKEVGDLGAACGVQISDFFYAGDRGMARWKKKSEILGGLWITYNEM